MESLIAKADSGDVGAQNEVGMKYEKGINTPKNLQLAAKYYKLASDKKDALGAYNYGRLLQEGLGVKRNLEEAKKQFQFASDEGIPEASFYLGKIFEKEKKYQQAKDQYRKAADNGHVESQIKLAKMIEQDRSQGPNKFAEAARYYQIAANNGNALAQAHLGSLFEKGKGVPKDIKGALKLYHQSAEKGCAQGQYYLAKMYQKGYGNTVKQSTENAIKYYNMAIKQNHIQAMIDLSDMYEKNNNMQEALPLIKRAAEMNNVYAMMHYATLIQEMNPNEAFAMVKKASDMRNVEALTKLGTMILNGIGIQRNDSEAMNVFKLASDHGSAEAMFYVANMYRVGRGTEKNQAESRRYLKMAAKAGHQKAKEIVATLPEEQKPQKQNAPRGRGGRNAHGPEQDDNRKPRGGKTDAAPRGERGGGNQRGRGGGAQQRGRGGETQKRGRGGESQPRAPQQQQNKTTTSNQPPKTAPIPPQGAPKPTEPQQQQAPNPPQQQQAPKPPKQPKQEEPKQKPESFHEAKLDQKKSRGGPEAQYALAKHFLEKDSYNITLAYHFMRLAAERVPDAIMQISDLLIDGTFGTPPGTPNVPAAIHYLNIGVRFSYVPAMKKLAQIYIEGKLIDRDVKAGANYIKLAADAGDAEQAFRFSKMLREGEYVLQNAAKADEYLKKAADLKLLDAQLIVADRLFKSKNPKAAEYYEGAANNGNVTSMSIIGEMYRDGDFIKKDYKKAKKYLAMAAQKGGDEEKEEYEDFLKMIEKEKENISEAQKQ
ncbi:sel1 repeat family protein [Histomonas meleagridis]|uniref:sel1 repeat family protein n=1 Tax=Histomonas meleagridis TaxID=135588 RepID=UPI00355A6F89|nr:sel1 repeat family protein [Histomonas meleagridis]KAH0796814.1 sel1 repeat family protein [Histomonas meleagridis]